MQTQEWYNWVCDVAGWKMASVGPFFPWFSVILKCFLRMPQFFNVLLVWKATLLYALENWRRSVFIKFDRTDNSCGTLALQHMAQFKNRKETNWNDPGTLAALEAIAERHGLAAQNVTYFPYSHISNYNEALKGSCNKIEAKMKLCFFLVKDRCHWWSGAAGSLPFWIRAHHLCSANRNQRNSQASLLWGFYAEVSHIPSWGLGSIWHIWVLSW